MMGQHRQGEKERAREKEDREIRETDRQRDGLKLKKQGKGVTTTPALGRWSTKILLSSMLTYYK